MNKFKSSIILISLIFLTQKIGNCQDVHITVYNRNGIKITGKDARTLMAASGKGYDSDVLINPNTLEQLVDLPLVNSFDGLSFSLLNKPVALAVNWPTVRGYSLIILDNGGEGFSTPSSINFTYQAAHDARHHLDLALATRSTYRYSRSFEKFYKRALYHLSVADKSTDESIRGKNGQLALDNIAQAMDILLVESGSNNLNGKLSWIGFTFSDISNYKAKLILAQKIAGSHTWIRVVFDPSHPISYYSSLIEVAHQMNIKILGLPVDSSYDKQYTEKSYEQQVEKLVNYFPQVDAWEIGNEVNGNWLSSTIATRVSKAAAYVKSHSKAKVVLTLFWEMGTGDSKHSTFNWARENISQSTRNNIDVVLLSMYVDNVPMGLAFDQVMQQLQKEFSTQQIGLGELGYWETSTSKIYWAMDKANILNARKLIAAQYYMGSLSFHNSIGGGFWWYFPETFPIKTALKIEQK